MIRRGWWSALATVILFGIACVNGRPPEGSGNALPGSGAAILADISGKTGIDIRTICGSATKRYIIESTGSGVGLIDYDGDGDLDVYFVNGATIPILRGKEAPVRNALYRNDGDWRFTDVTDEAGVGDGGWGGGCAVGDIDNDGDPDLFVANFGRNVLYENLGDGTFREKGKEAGVDDGDWGLSAAFGDIDNDGDLDLYVTNYVLFDLDDPGEAGDLCPWLGLQVFCGPSGLIAQADRLYRNDGKGNFEDITGPSGIRDPGPHFGMGVALGDYDDDGWVDIYVANDADPNLLFHNLGGGSFAEIAVQSGVAFKEEGDPQAGMGTDFGDFDRDGRADIFVTNFSQDHNTLYRNEGDGLFGCATYHHRLGEVSWLYVGWGTKFFDLDNDGDEDLYVANGHVYPSVDGADLGLSYGQGDQLLVNSGTGRYRDVSDRIRSGEKEPGSSRGAAFGDIDDDGDIDIIISEIDGRPTVLENRGGNKNGWLRVRLVGTKSNRDGAGARLWLTAGGRIQRKEATRSGSYCSSNDPRVHFGIGAAKEIERLVVRWPSGQVQVLDDIPANREITIHEH